MRSSNPVFSNIEKHQAEHVVTDENCATFKGIAAKTLLLLLTTIIVGIFAPQILASNPALLYPVLIFSGIASFICVFVAMLSLRLAAPMAIIYSVIQGMFLGLVTAVLEALMLEYVGQGVAIAAMVGTASVFCVMLGLYYTGLIKVTNRLRNIVLGSLISVLIASLIISITGMSNLIFANFGISIAISAFMIILGAFMLTLDFERANQLVKMNADKRTEWQAALGFMVTIIWIYVEMLRLAVILLARRD